MKPTTTMSTQNSYPKINILGVEVDIVTKNQAIDLILNKAKQPEACYVVKPYVEFIDKANRNKPVRQLLNQAYLCLPDGISLRWAATYLSSEKTGLLSWFTSVILIVLRPSSTRKIIPERLAGSSFTWPLLQACSNQDIKVFLVGSPKHQSIEHTAGFISTNLPGLNIVGTAKGRDDDGVFSNGLQSELLRQLQQTRPDVIFLGLGFPLQERVAAQLSQQLRHGVLIGEGGTFDFSDFGGKIQKAPRWLQAVELEWLWRLLREPSRLKRQLAIPRFMYGIYRFKKLRNKLPS